MSDKTLAYIKFDFELHRYQFEFDMQFKRFNICICTRGWGKTVYAVLKLFLAALDSKKRSTFAYIAPTKTQAEDITREIIPEFLGSLIDADLVISRDRGMTYEFPNTGSIVRFYGTDAPNHRAIRGKTFAGVVVDEFDEVKEAIYKEVIRPTLRGGGWIMLIGTIKPGGNLVAFKSKYQNNVKWNIATYPFSECWKELPAYDEEERESLLEEYADSPNTWAREFECDETATDADCLIPAKLIYDAQAKVVSADCVRGHPIVLGVDPATGSGADKSVIAMRQGLESKILKKVNVDNMALADIVVSYIDLHDPQAVFIDAGRGEGVISRLRQLGYGNIIIPVDFGGKPLKSKYYNKRTEIYCELREWLREGGSLPEDRDLMQELLTPIIMPNERGKIKMEPKDAIKKRLIRSPDSADALAVTFAVPFRFSDSQGKSGGTVVKADYKPPHLRDHRRTAAKRSTVPYSRDAALRRRFG